MKKYFLALILVFGLVSVTNANEIDKCFNYLKSQNYQLAMQAGQNAVKIYPNSSNAHFCLGAAYTNLDYFNLGIKELKIAEKLTNNKNVLGRIYSLIGINYDILDDLDNALFYYYRALQIEKDLNDKEGESLVLSNIAGIYKKQSNYDKALEYYNKSLQLTSDPSSITTIYNNIAFVYLYKGDNNKSVEYFKKALELAQEASNYRGTAKYMLNMALPYIRLKNFSEAEYYLNQGLKMVKKLGDKYLEAYGYAIFGKLYLAQNQESLEKEYFTKAYNLYESIGDNSDAQWIYENYLK
jgi:tetratricopeptide (TPR) repeat protein